MHTRPAPVSTFPVARARPGIGRALVAVAVLVALTILKPWGDGPIPGATRRGGGDPGAVGAALPLASDDGRVSPTPRAARSPGPGEIPCSATSWEVVSLDRLADWTARAWIPASPVIADSPLDPAIDEVALSSSAVLAVGACAPLTAADGQSVRSVAAAVVAAWRRDGANVRPIQVELAGRGAADDGLALLYRPSGTSGSRPSWPAGHFVLELEPVDGTEPASGLTVSPGPDRSASWFIGIAVGGLP